MPRSAGSARSAGTHLHRIVYGIAVLGAVHFFIQSKLNIYEPVLMAGFLLWLLAYRVLYRRNNGVTPAHLLGLTVVTAARHRSGRSRDLHGHERRERMAHPAGASRCRHGDQAGVVGAGRRTCRLRDRPGGGGSRRVSAPSARKISAAAISGATQVQSGS